MTHEILYSQNALSVESLIGALTEIHNLLSFAVEHGTGRRRPVLNDLRPHNLSVHHGKQEKGGRRFVGTRFPVALPRSRSKETGHVPGIPVCTAGPLHKVKGCTLNWLFAAAGIHSLGGGGSSGSGGCGGGGGAYASGGGGGGCLAP